MMKVTEESMCKVDVIFINFSSISIFTGFYCVPLSTEVLDGLGYSGGNKVLGCYNEWLRYVPGKVRQTVGT